MLLGGAAAAGVAWSAPAVLGVDRAAAAPFSCVDQTVAWNSVTGSNPWTVTGTSGDITVQARIRAFVSAGATATTTLNLGNIVQRMSGHAIGDYWNTRLTFSHASGTICQASATILDIDQNDIGLGCATVSRFNDEISNLGGAGLSVTTQGGLIQRSPGVYGSSLLCKTGDTENLAMTWSVASGVLNGRFRWTARTPPNGSPTLDLQLIKLTPFVICATVASPTPAPAAASASTFQRGGIGD